MTPPVARATTTRSPSPPFLPPLPPARSRQENDSGPRRGGELTSLRSSRYSHRTEVDEARGQFDFDCSGFVLYAPPPRRPRGLRGAPACDRPTAAGEGLRGLLEAGRAAFPLETAGRGRGAAPGRHHRVAETRGRRLPEYRACDDRRCVAAARPRRARAVPAGGHRLHRQSAWSQRPPASCGRHRPGSGPRRDRRGQRRPPLWLSLDDLGPLAAPLHAHRPGTTGVTP